MGLGKKLFKTVVSDNVSSLVGTNKNDVKVAKIELKKAKAEEKTNEKNQIRKLQLNLLLDMIGLQENLNRISQRKSKTILSIFI